MNRLSFTSKVTLAILVFGARRFFGCVQSPFGYAKILYDRKFLQLFLSYENNSICLDPEICCLWDTRTTKDELDTRRPKMTSSPISGLEIGFLIWEPYEELEHNARQSNSFTVLAVLCIGRYDVQFHDDFCDDQISPWTLVSLLVSVKYNNTCIMPSALNF